MVQAIGGLVFGVACLAGIACWLVAVWSNFKAVANRKPGVSAYRAWCWFQTMIFERNIYPEDIFTDAGRYWLRKSLHGFAGFVIAWVIAAIVGVATFPN